MTIKDIAKEAGYSVGTVSRVLNNHPDVSDKARKKVMAVVKKNHFKLNNNAKHLKQQSNSGIAVIVKGNNNMLFATIVEKLQGLIKERGYVCLIYYIDEDENEVEQALQICRERQPMGILFLGSDLEYYRGRFGDAGIPGLLVTNSAEGMELENLSSVSTDDEGAAQTAIEYLFTLGHREIGVLGGKLENSYAARSRYMGCRRAFDHRDVHRNQIPLKGGVSALLDSVPKALPGLFTKPIHADDFSPVTIQTVNIQITMDKSLTDEFFQCSLRQPFNVHCLLADKMDELFQPTCLAVRVITVQRLDDAILAIFALST